MYWEGKFHSDLNGGVPAGAVREPESEDNLPSTPKDSGPPATMAESRVNPAMESAIEPVPEKVPPLPVMACRILSIANQKGGVGKTTTAINLSASLALTGRRVLIIDMDPQSNATSALGQKVEHKTRTIYDVLLGEASLREATLATDTLGICLVPSSPQFAGAEVELVSVENREFLLKNQLDSLKSEYDYIIIDCPPSLGLLTVNALCASDGVIVPIQCEYLALEGLSHLLETLQAVRKSLNPRLRVEGLLLTMYDGRLSLSQQVANDARAYFGSRVYRTMIPRNVRLGEAPSFGKPVVLYDRACAGSMSYINLAKEIMENESQGVGAWSESAHTGLSG